MKSSIATGLLLVVCLWIGGCGAQKERKEGIYVVATTGMIADAAAQIGGSKVVVEGLMGPGVDPHLYKAKPSDLQKMRDADVIFYNGIHLEGKMAEVFEKLAEQKPVFALGEAISESELMVVDAASGTHDPHIWFDVALWKKSVLHMGEKMASLYPEEATVFRNNALLYASQLDTLHLWVTEQMASIPVQSRVLVTAHDAFGYFGRAYQTEVRGLQGISTVSEPGLADVRNLVDFISERKIRSVFVESSVPEKLLKAVVNGCQENGHEVQVGGTLFSDAMGAANSPEGNYMGMVRYNVTTIVQGLK